MLKGGALSSHCHFHIRKADPYNRLELKARPGDLIWNDRARWHSSEPPYTPLQTRIGECFDKVSTFYWLWPKPLLSTKLSKQTKKCKVFHVADKPLPLSSFPHKSSELDSWLLFLRGQKMTHLYDTWISQRQMKAIGSHMHATKTTQKSACHLSIYY